MPRTPVTAAILAAAAALVIISLWTAVSAPRRCTAPPKARGTDAVTLEPMFGAMAFDKPVQAIQHPRDPATWFVVLHRGAVVRVRGREVSTLLDISDRVRLGREWGLQDIALHPSFPDDPRVYAAYVTGKMVSKLSVFTLAPGGDVLDPTSEVLLLSERHAEDYHAITNLKFGPDGYLYIGWGFGGQDVVEAGLRGKILRIDVDRSDGALPYAVPSDNPFLGTSLRPETYAIGLRVPWRMSFDRETGALWVGDVGSHGYEEIDRIVAGGDYGWPAWEGTACYDPAKCKDRRNDPPVFQHSHSDVCSIIGGYVYRGGAMPALHGKYLYSDSCTGTIWALDTSGDLPVSEPVGHARTGVASIAKDRDGELYIIETKEFDEEYITPGRDFRILKLVPNARPSDARTAAPAPHLSETGCLTEDFRSAPAGMMAYSLNQPPWEDGTSSYHFTTIRRMKRHWGTDVESFVPAPDSVLLKTIALGNRPIETQMLVRRSDGTWDAFDYRWNEDASDAIALTRTTTASIAADREWQFPGPDRCVLCHNTTVGMVRGFTASQMNRETDGENQISRLERLGAIVWPWKGGRLAALPPLDDEAVSVEQRARAYLHVNCAHCHQPGGNAARVNFDLRRETPLALSGACGTPPASDLPGHEDALIIAPGNPQKSLVSIRMHASGTAAMPPDRRVVDPAGTEVVDAWIRSLTQCPTGSGEHAFFAP